MSVARGTEADHRGRRRTVGSEGAVAGRNPRPSVSTLPPSRACALWSVTPPVVPSRRAKPGGWRGLRDEWRPRSESRDTRPPPSRPESSGLRSPHVPPSRSDRVAPLRGSRLRRVREEMRDGWNGKTEAGRNGVWWASLVRSLRERLRREWNGRRRAVKGTERTKRESNGVRRGPRDSILFTLNLFIPHAFVIFILFVFHLLRLVQGKLYRYSPRLIENLPKAGINLGFSFFICRTFIIGGFY